MQKQTDTKNRDRETDEELADVLNAISVVSKRLAKKLNTLSQQEKKEENQSEPVTTD